MPKLLQTCPLKRATDGDIRNQCFPATDLTSFTHSRNPRAKIPSSVPVSHNFRDATSCRTLYTLSEQSGRRKEIVADSPSSLAVTEGGREGLGREAAVITALNSGSSVRLSQLASSIESSEPRGEAGEGGGGGGEAAPR